MKDCKECKDDCKCDEICLLWFRVNLTDSNEPNIMTKCQLFKLREVVLKQSKKLFKGEISIDCGTKPIKK